MISLSLFFMSTITIELTGSFRLLLVFFIVVGRNWENWLFFELDITFTLESFVIRKIFI